MNDFIAIQQRCWKIASRKTRCAVFRQWCVFRVDDDRWRCLQLKIMALFFGLLLSALVLWFWRSNNSSNSSSSSNRIIIIVAFIQRSTTTAEIVAWLQNWTAVWLQPNSQQPPKTLQPFPLLSLPRRPVFGPNECIRLSKELAQQWWCNSKTEAVLAKPLSPRDRRRRWQPQQPPWPEIMAIGSPQQPPPILPQSPWILSIVSPYFLPTFTRA